MAPPRSLPVSYKYGEEYTLREHVVTRGVKEGQGRPLLLSPSDATRYASKEALYRERKSDLGKPGLNLKKVIFKAPIRIGPECGSQILLTEEGDVAKVYDPLCYRFIDPYYEQKVDVVSQAEYQFQNEALAYSALREAGLCGSVVPGYLGSWTITLADPTARGKDQGREVHLILMEYVEGVEMSEVPVEAVSDATRQGIMVGVMEALTDLMLSGVEHNSFEPYNIILPGDYKSMSFSASNQSPYRDRANRVCVIDFALSHTDRVESSEREDCQCRKCIAETHCNPLYFWAGTDKFSQYGWLPWDLREATDWMWQVWGKPTEEKYSPAERDEKCSFGQPLRADRGQAN